LFLQPHRPPGSRTRCVRRRHQARRLRLQHRPLARAPAFALPHTRRFDIDIRPVFALVAVTVALTATATAYGVLDGSLDAGRHPAAGALLVPGPNGLEPECSGVLVSPRVFVTAGHCTNFASAAGGAFVVFGDQLRPDTWTPIHGTAITDP